MANYRVANALRDKGHRFELDGKSIEGRNGAHIFSRAPSIFDHFVGDEVHGFWSPSETGAATPFAVLAAQDGGVANMVTGAVSGNAQIVAAGLNFRPTNMATRKPLVFEARCRVPSNAAVEYVIGLSDALTEASSIAYAVSATSTLSTHAPSNAAVFVYSSVPTSGALFNAGGNYYGVITTIADVDTISALTVQADTAYHIFRIEIDVNGAANFYLDDKHVKYVNAAVTADVPYTPFINIITRTAGAKTFYSDYIFTGGDLSADLT